MKIINDNKGQQLNNTTKNEENEFVHSQPFYKLKNNKYGRSRPKSPYMNIFNMHSYCKDESDVIVKKNIPIDTEFANTRNWNQQHSSYNEKNFGDMRKDPESCFKQKKVSFDQSKQVPAERKLNNSSNMNYDKSVLSSISRRPLETDSYKFRNSIARIHKSNYGNIVRSIDTTDDGGGIFARKNLFEDMNNPAKRMFTEEQINILVRKSNKNRK